MSEIIYLDPIIYHCYRTDDGTRIPYETDFFNGKCDIFVEGYYIIPAGETVTLPNGRTFTGEMIAPWKPYSELDAAQRTYERQLLAEYEEALKVVGVTV